MEYTILGFLIVLVFIFYLQKIMETNTDEITSKYAVLAEKLDNLAAKTETFRENLNKSQTDLSEK